jgi:hypothetical protein
LNELTKGVFPFDRSHTGRDVSDKVATNCKTGFIPALVHLFTYIATSSVTLFQLTFINSDAYHYRVTRFGGRFGGLPAALRNFQRRSSRWGGLRIFEWRVWSFLL